MKKNISDQYGHALEYAISYVPLNRFNIHNNSSTIDDQVRDRIKYHNLATKLKNNYCKNDKPLTSCVNTKYKSSDGDIKAISHLPDKSLASQQIDNSHLSVRFSNDWVLKLRLHTASSRSYPTSVKPDTKETIVNVATITIPLP